MKKLLVFLAISSMGISGVMKMNKNEDVLSTTYEIYPNVQNIEYQDSSLSLTKHINIVNYVNGLDDATKEKAFDVVSLKPVLTSVTTNISDDLTNLILVTSENEYVSSLNEDLSYIENKIDAYYLEINNKNIVIVGKNTDSVFYGLSTLQYIFEQSKNTIRCLKIKDYAQSELRGFIEGYYGIPWTAEERKELMRFGSRIKNNIYIYAPKDDVYHSTSWRSLYTQDDYKKLKEQVQVGVATKTRFAWAIHPFMNKPMTPSTYEDDLVTIKQKFEQIYQAGVRQFVVSADDINLYAYGHESERIVDIPAHATLQRNLINALSAWCKQKGDCYKLVFVPTVYHENCEYSGNEYFGVLTDGLDESIQIMWTGAKVCSTMNNMAYDKFSEYTNDKKPFIWMNWPVNDYAINYLMLGEGEVFNKTYDNDDEVEFAGIVVNPLQLAEASKMSLWACGDYSWNTKAFNTHQSWLDSLKYIEGNKTDEFMHIAEHLTSAGEFEGTFFKEAESMKVLITNFKEVFEAEQDVTETVNALNTYLDNLITDIDSYLANATNLKLVTNIRPWVLALRYGALTTKQYLWLLMNEDDISLEELRTEYYKAVDYKEEMLGQTAPNLISGKYAIEERPAYASKTVITPFVSYLEDNVGDEICIKLGIDTGIKFFGYDSIYEGELTNITDGDEETYCWFSGSSLAGYYVRLDLGEVREIKDVTVVFGNTDAHSQDIMTGRIELSSDAKNWITIGELNSNRNVADIRDNPVNARFIRLYQTEDTTKWMSIREVFVNTIPDDEPMITFSGLGGVEDGELKNIVDNDDNTYVWLSKKTEGSNYIQIDYRENKIVGDIQVNFGRPSDPDGKGGLNDTFEGELQVSINGTDWTKIGDLTGLTAQFDFRDNPKTFRYLRMYSESPQPRWVCVRGVYLNNIPSTTPIITYSGIQGIYEGKLLNMVDNDLSTYCWFSSNVSANGYILFNYQSQIDIESIRLTFGKPGSNDKFVGELQYSNDGVNWTKIGNLNNLVETFDLRASPINAQYVRLFTDTDQSGWVCVTDIQLNVLTDSTPLYEVHTFELQEGSYLNLCDGDLSTYAHFSKGDTHNAYIILDALSVKKINSIRFVQGNNDSGDFLPRFTIYISNDKENWSTIGENEYADVFDLNLDLSSEDVSARYIKIKSNWDLTSWVMIKEFSIN